MCNVNNTSIEVLDDRQKNLLNFIIWWAFIIAFIWYNFIICEVSINNSVI
jgi:hypothetical protein